MERNKCVFPVSFHSQVVTPRSLGHAPENWLLRGERQREKERTLVSPICMIACFVEKGNGKNFNVILFLLTGAMSWIFNLPLLWAPGKCLYPRAWGLSSVLMCQCLAVQTIWEVTQGFSEAFSSCVGSKLTSTGDGHIAPTVFFRSLDPLCS